MSKRKKDKHTLPLQPQAPARITPVLPDKSRAPRFRQSGHYIDQKLKHSYDRDKGVQLTIFDELRPETKALIKEEEVVVEGIKLSVREEKILTGILKLLSDKSRGGSHTGNEPPERTIYGGQSTKAPRLRISPHELYAEFTGTKDYSGREAKDARETLYGLQDKKFLIVYKRHRPNSKGETVIDRIEEFRPLLKIVTYYEGLTKEEDSQLDKGEAGTAQGKAEIILALSPLFIDQISTKFIEFPADINRQTAIAAGGARKVHTAITQLRDYLLRYKSGNKGATYTLVDEDTLPHVLGLEKYVKESRKKLIAQRIDEAIEACKNLGIIHEAKKVTGKKGQYQYKFILNTEY